jgi:type II secretory pathway pseudopilin PulG
MRKSRFTLVELLFVITILVILISIGFVAGTKVLRKQAKAKTQAEIKILESACYQYKDRYGKFPDISGNKIEFNFCKHLAKIPVTPSFDGDRYFYIDFKRHNINLSGWTAQDPYEQPYMYKYADNKIKIWSVGLDPNNPSDDISN